MDWSCDDGGEDHRSSSVHFRDVQRKAHINEIGVARFGLRGGGIMSTTKRDDGYAIGYSNGNEMEWRCDNCGAEHACEVTDEPDMVPCQGSDECRVRLCEDCRVKCDRCGLYSCTEHANEIVGLDGKMCDTCDTCVEQATSEPETGDCYCAGDHCACGMGGGRTMIDVINRY